MILVYVYVDDWKKIYLFNYALSLLSFASHLCKCELSK